MLDEAPFYVFHATAADCRAILAAWDRLEAKARDHERRAKAARLSRRFWFHYVPAEGEKSVFMVTPADVSDAYLVAIRGGGASVRLMPRGAGPRGGGWTPMPPRIKGRELVARYLARRAEH